MTKPILGIIGGSGLYDFAGLVNPVWQRVESKFGQPSDALLFGSYGGLDLVFLPRHGRGHRIPPSEVNYRANIEVLKRVGVTEVVSISACGSLKEQLAPGMFVVVDQFIDRTFARAKSFFTTGLVAHVSMEPPVCKRLGQHIVQALGEIGVSYQQGGTYLAMEGPQFSTLAEAELYRSWNCDVVGMTNMPEAKLAREAELCYASVAAVTDYDCWHPEHDNVNVEAVLNTLLTNASKAAELICALAPRLSGRTQGCECGCHTSLDQAVVTAPQLRDPQVVAQLDAVAGRVLGGQK